MEVDSGSLTNMSSQQSTTLDQTSVQESILQSNPPPTLADFRAPSNQFEHNLIVTRLMEGGSLRSEAEQAISSRKAAFNKALREYKKSNVNPLVNKRGNKNSKHTNSQSNQNGYQKLFYFLKLCFVFVSQS